MSEELKSCPFCGSSGNCDVAFPHPSKNPTNWPNPERPGVPMFPEKTSRHVLKKKDTGEIIIRNWKYDGQHWDMIGHSAQWCSETYFYVGPVLTPTQIAELLAEERERCAKACDDVAAEICAQNIRNLGAAP